MSGSGLIPRCPPAYLESYERDLANDASAAQLESYEQSARAIPPIDDDDEGEFTEADLHP